jgi:hypothetical protein
MSNKVIETGVKAFGVGIASAALLSGCATELKDLDSHPETTASIDTKNSLISKPDKNGVIYCLDKENGNLFKFHEDNLNKSGDLVSIQNPEKLTFENTDKAKIADALSEIFIANASKMPSVMKYFVKKRGPYIEFKEVRYTYNEGQYDAKQESLNLPMGVYDFGGPIGRLYDESEKFKTWLHENALIDKSEIGKNGKIISQNPFYDNENSIYNYKDAEGEANKHLRKFKNQDSKLLKKGYDPDYKFYPDEYKIKTSSLLRKSPYDDMADLAVNGSHKLPDGAIKKLIKSSGAKDGVNCPQVG